VYQGARFLEASLRSVLAQSFRDFEIVIVDDGSTDGSHEVATRVAATSGEQIDVRVLRNSRRLGLVGNWNRCLEVTHGKHILLFHQDDVLEPGMLERSVAALEQEPDLGLVYSTFCCMDEEGRELPPWSTSPFVGRAGGRTLLEALLHENFICCPAVVVPRAVYDRVGGYDPRFAFSPDFEMWLRIASRYDLFCCRERGVRYRLHPSQATEAFRTTKLARGELEYLSAALAALKPQRDAYPELWREVVRNSLWMFRQYVRTAPADAGWALRILMGSPVDVLLATRDALLEKSGLRPRARRERHRLPATDATLPGRTAPCVDSGPSH
jgi:glycosyltransferase involved in cell wall biosynthesis